MESSREQKLAEEARKWDSGEMKPTDPGWRDAPEAIPRRIRKIRVEPFRFWWNVLEEGDGKEFGLLFRSVVRANDYAEALREGASLEELRQMERGRLSW